MTAVNPVNTTTPNNPTNARCVKLIDDHLGPPSSPQPDATVDWPITRLPNYQITQLPASRPLPDREDIPEAADDHDAVGDRGSRHDHLTHRVRRQQLVLRPRLDDEDVTVLARHIDFAIRCDRR